MSTNTAARTVIVCVPTDTTIDWFSASGILDWHKLPAGTPAPCSRSVGLASSADSPGGRLGT